MAESMDSTGIARKDFGVGRRGYEQQQVRAFLHEVSSLVERLQREAVALEERAHRAEARLGMSEHPDDSMLLEMLGEETTRVLSSARDAAAEIRAKAEAAAERIIETATSEAASTRSEAVREADRRLAEALAEGESMRTSARVEVDRLSAEATDATRHLREELAAQAQAARDELDADQQRALAESAALADAGRIEGRQMVAEAQVVREQVLRDLAARRKKARQQVEKLNAGRERLLEAYDVVRRTMDEATNELVVSLSDARMAGESATRLLDDEPEPTIEQLEEEVRSAVFRDPNLAAAKVSELVEDMADDSQDAGPLSGEVPVVAVAVAASTPEGEGPSATAVQSDGGSPEAADLAERRGRKGRRRKTGAFDGLPSGALIRVEPPSDSEGIRILDEPAEAEESAAAPLAVVEVVAAVEDLPAATDVFARLRADQSAETEPETAVAEDAEPAAVAEDAEPAAVEDPAGVPFRERDAAIASIDKELSRRLKRTLADEQNEVLDRLRRVKPKGVDDLLPPATDHAARWAEAASAALLDAARAGANGASPPSVDDLVDDLAMDLTAPLRDRIERSFAASDGNLEDVADRLRAVYREWKGQRLSEASSHFLTAAYGRGSFEQLRPDEAVRWVLDPAAAPCPDCDDNVLAGAIGKGEEFPTGHRCAPAHPGCRCLVAAANP